MMLNPCLVPIDAESGVIVPPSNPAVAALAYSLASVQNAEVEMPGFPPALQQYATKSSPSLFVDV